MSAKSIVKKWVNAFHNADVDALASLYAADATHHPVADEPVVGRENIRAMFEREFGAANKTCIVENVFEDGEWAIL